MCSGDGPAVGPREVPFSGPDRADHLSWSPQSRGAPPGRSGLEAEKVLRLTPGAIGELQFSGAFSDWDPDALAAYVECGFQGESPVTLACRPEAEADIYRASNDHDTFERLGEIEIPVLILAGESSDTITPEFARTQATQFSSAGVEIVFDTGNFLPMEKPDLLADRVARIVRTFDHQ